MFKQIINLIVCVLLFVFLSGCLVSKSKYSKKVNELDELQNNYSSLEQKNADLSLEIGNLTAEKGTLENTLLSKSDELVKNKAKWEETVEELKSKKEREVQELNKTYDEMTKKMKFEIDTKQVTISKLENKLKVNMLEAILFDLGKAEIKPEGMAALEKLVEVLKNSKDHEIRVEGHTDNLKIHGELAKKYPTNWELSSARAINVVKYIQSQGVDPKMISATAFGEYRPIKSNETEENRAQNRRIEIILIPIK